MKTDKRDVPLNRRDFLKLSGVAAGGFAVAPRLLGLTGAVRPTAARARAAASPSGTLTMSQPADATTMDPQLQGDVADMNILVNIFDFLTTRNDSNHLVGQLATSWEAVNPTTWRFHLRKGVKFHNGEPFDASVVKFSIERLLNPKTASPIVEFADAGVTGVNVIDQYTADIVSKEPAPIIPAQSALFDGVMVPPQYISQVGDATFAKKPVGTGPFKFVEWLPGNMVVLEANTEYWGGAPGVQRLVIKPIVDTATTLASLESGEIDMATGLVGGDVTPLAGAPNIKIVSVPGIREYFVELDCISKGPLSDVRVRQALNYAVDVEALIKTFLAGYGRQTATLLPPIVFGYYSPLAPYPYDPAKAKKLLAEAGYPKGFKTALSANTSNVVLMQAIAGQLAKVGVHASVKTYAIQTFTELDYVNHGNALGPMYVENNSGWSLDGYSYLQSYIKPSSRSSRWNNKTATSLVNTEQTSVQSAQRASAFVELQALMKADAPFIFLFVSDLVVPMRTNVQWKPNALGMQAMNGAKIT